MRKITWILVSLLGLHCIPMNDFAQVAISTGSITPNGSSGLDISFTDKGLLIPRVDLSSVLTSLSADAAGLLVYNTNALFGTGTGFYFNTSSTAVPDWVKIGNLSGTGTGGYALYWTGTNTIGAEPYLSTWRGGMGASITAAGAGELIYSSGVSAYGHLAAGTSGYVLTSGGAGAPSWTNPAGLGVKWNALAAPDGNLTISHSINTTTHNTAVTTGAFWSNVASAVTSGKILDINTGVNNTWTGNELTSGLVNIASSSTAGTGSAYDVLLNIQRSGTNANSGHRAVGIYSNVANTGTSSVNYGLYSVASGAATNWAGYFSGNVGLGGTAIPSELRFYEPTASGTNYSGFKAQAQTNDVSYYLPSGDGTNGQVLSTNGAGALYWIDNGAIGSGSVGRVTFWSGTNTVSSSAYFTWDNDYGKLGVGIMVPTAKLHIKPDLSNALQIEPFGINAGQTGEFRMMELEANGTNYAGIKAADNIASSVVWTLPSADGTNGQVLMTNGTKTLSWTSKGATGSGTSGRVTFWTGTSTVSANNDFSWDNMNSRLGIGVPTPLAKLHLKPDNAAALLIEPYGTSAGNTGEIRLYELLANGGQYAGLKAADDMASDITWKLPVADGTYGQFLSTDGSGSLSWSNPLSGGLSNKLAFWTGTGTLSYNNNLTWDNTNFIMGIGTAAPNSNTKLEVKSTSLYSGYFTTPYGSTYTHVVHAEYTGTSAYDAIAVYGKSAPASNYGIGGSFVGNWKGAEFTGYQGVWATGSSVGVYGMANGPATNYGIWGSATGGNTNYAGMFSGDVYILGSISKGSGTFRIDHPLDPENKILNHSFVESPDMKNVYDGVAVLDATGSAVVELPDYFEALNMDFRYQLTAIGAPGPNLYIAEEVQNNSFRISGGQPGMKVSWQVTGIRKDPYAVKNRIRVEVEKTAEERGKYLYPAAYGKPEEMGIDYSIRKKAEVRR